MEMYIMTFFGLVLLFLIVTYGVQMGIDSSKQVKALKMELKNIKKQIKELEEKQK
ncbi:DUF5320 domain-containing protein [Ureibacillus sp. Re31]|uniref:DUF5320 domain-containing protein n=1 Tax=Ureibacillus galli TaxID=2762222 RepID=A0ABR8X9V4_9BACL|nr:DUF5320 domain-containing protein [Ureibacillus galli]MBD8025978.1 DUF5320 domain-containing protein [Ureibacillus galli]